MLPVVLQARTSKQQQPPSFYPIYLHLDTSHLQNKHVHFSPSPKKLTGLKSIQYFCLDGFEANLPAITNQALAVSAAQRCWVTGFLSKQSKANLQARYKSGVPDRKADVRDWTMSASTMQAAAGRLVKKEPDPIYLMWSTQVTTYMKGPQHQLLQFTPALLLHQVDSC